MYGFAKTVDYTLLEEYRRRIDVEAVLDHYGAENCFQIGNEIQHSCLVDRVDPHHSNGDKNPSARANLDEKLYVCYSYGGGDIFWLIQKMEGADSVADILPVVAQFLGESTLDTESFLTELKKFFESDEAAVEPPTYHPRVLKRWQMIHPYLYEDRGIAPWACEELGLGYDPEAVRIVFPHWAKVRGETKLVGWQRRSLTDPRWPVTPPESRVDLDGNVHLRPPPKYKNSPGLPKNETVYNLERLRERGVKRICVVESPMSVAKALTLSDREDPTDILGAFVSTFGAKVGKEQIRLLADFNEVLVWMDDDVPGRKASRILLEGLYRQTNVLHIEPDTGMDPADYWTRDEIMAPIGRAEPAVLTMSRWRP
ncbi:DnaG-like DNA primase [Rhodococcus phage E3]|uniref:DnaG-like DNA primase n=1 Tax=Rhodococcus phage E3 TaxID=1007869 RepID=UPI0002C6DB94|nr:DnaG-like DNA primase [Rhodococcus phage E3]AEQ21066.1 DnaG-like DNA primase [Rhodococcus phage E3]